MNELMGIIEGALGFLVVALAMAGVYLAFLWGWNKLREHRRHHHVFDSDVSAEQYGTLIVLGCRCGAGRVYAAK